MSYGYTNEVFDIVFYHTIDEVRKYIQSREGKTVQQVAYSSYHDALTCIDFKAKRIVTNLPKEVIS